MNRQPKTITWHELVTRADDGTLTAEHGRALVAEVERLRRAMDAVAGWLCDEIGIHEAECQAAQDAMRVERTRCRSLDLSEAANEYSRAALSLHMARRCYIEIDRQFELGQYEAVKQAREEARQQEMERIARERFGWLDPVAFRNGDAG